MATYTLGEAFRDKFFTLKIEQFLQVLREEIANADAVASGRLRDFTYDLHVDGYNVQIAINLPAYWRYVDEGVNGIRRNQNSRFSFRTLPPSRSHVSAIEEWIKIKGIVPRNKLGRFEKRSTTAYAMAYAQKVNGIKPRRFMLKAKQRNAMTIHELKKYVVDAISRDAILGTKRDKLLPITKL